MLTIIVLSTAQSRISAVSVAGMIFMQLLLGIAFGTGFAIIAKYVINKAIIKTPGFDIVFIIAIVLLAYAATSMLGGNGYLSVYITGIILGNTDILGKKELVPFFDGITGLMQIVIFFLLGLLAYPSRLPQIAPTALILAVFITLIARPFTVSLLLLPFKAGLNQIFIISWAGFRGALSIVFAITATLNTVSEYDIFHSVFFIVLLSILVQGSLLSFAAKKSNMIDDNYDVMKTFSDYSSNLPIEFIQLTLDKRSCNKAISDLTMPPDSLIVLVKRGYFTERSDRAFRGGYHSYRGKEHRF